MIDTMTGRATGLPRKDFGIFYPVGYLVAAFTAGADARRVRHDLLGGGYEADDCTEVAGSEVAEASRRNLDANTGFLSRLGWADSAVNIHLEAALRGAAFLLIYAPGRTDVQRAMTVIRRGPFEFVHRYNRLSIEELD